MSIYKSKSGEWGVRWREGGQHRSRLIGTRADAKAVDAEIKRRRRLRGFESVASDMAFEEFVPIFWRGHLPTIEATTAERRQEYLEKRILPKWGRYKLLEITPPKVREWQVEMIEAGVGNPTQTKLLSILSLIFNEAILLGKVEINPVSAIKRPSQRPTHRPDPFPPSRVEEIRNVFLSEGKLAEATFTVIAAYAGARPPHEILGLTRADVGVKALVLRPQKGNAIEPRAVALLAPLAEDIEVWLQHTGIAVGKLFDWTPGRYRGYRERLQREFGLSRVYDLRHAFVTLLLQEGRSIEGYIAGQLGHHPSTCIDTYTHLKHLGDKQISAEDAIREARAAYVQSDRAAG